MDTSEAAFLGPSGQATGSVIEPAKECFQSRKRCCNGPDVKLDEVSYRICVRDIRLGVAELGSVVLLDDSGHGCEDAKGQYHHKRYSCSQVDV